MFCSHDHAVYVLFKKPEDFFILFDQDQNIIISSHQAFVEPGSLKSAVPGACFHSINH